MLVKWHKLALLSLHYLFASPAMHSPDRSPHSCTWIFLHTFSYSPRSTFSQLLRDCSATQVKPVAEGSNLLAFLSNPRYTDRYLNELDGTVYNLPITLIYCSASWGRTDEFIFSSFRRRQLQTAWSFYGQSINVIFVWIQIFIFLNVVPPECILAEFWIQELGWTLSHWQLCDHKLFFFSLYILFLLSHPALLLFCRKNMKYLSGHRVLKAQLLHGNVAGIRDNSLRWWAKQPFHGRFFFYVFRKRCKYGFLLTFAERWIWFLWLHPFASNWFKFGL